jgi:DNA-binding transcriptional MerR regulator/methylmalonyl-CoA mutase cobalamin-binding subunit
VFVSDYHAQTMYNIKQAAQRSGVTVPVLRAWERRYGIVSPARSSSGYRRFDDEAIARVRAMRGLVDSGWSPSAAAAAIVAGRVPVPRDDGAASAAAGGSIVPDDAAAGSAELAGRLVLAARDLDEAAVEAVLDDLFSRGSFERVASEALFPALERLGEAWASGEVSVAGEHLASGAVLRRLALAFEAAGRGSGARPRVLVGLPPGGRHELGALAFAVAARRTGLSVTYLGADLPGPDWVAAAVDADAAVVGVVTARDRKAALEVARLLATERSRVIVAFGGDAAPDVPGVMHLPRDLSQAVSALRHRLAEVPRPA